MCLHADLHGLSQKKPCISPVAKDNTQEHATEACIAEGLGYTAQSAFATMYSTLRQQLISAALKHALLVIEILAGLGGKWERGRDEGRGKT